GELPKHVVARLDELTKWDRELYDDAVQLFHEQTKLVPSARGKSAVAVPELPVGASAGQSPAPAIKLATLPTEAENPLRVGIWCWYNVTLEPSEGIGVFAHHLAKGLAALPNGPQISIFTKPGEQHVVDETVQAGNGRIRAISCTRPPYAK